MSDTPAPRDSSARRRGDPLGKRALFSAPAPEDGPADATARREPPPVAPASPPEPPLAKGATGRHDLFSGPVLGPRSVVVECHRCGARTPVGVAGLVRRLVPSLWFPPSRFSRYMRCPACGRFGWCRLDWSVFRPL